MIRLASLLGLTASLVAFAGLSPARADLHVIELTAPTIKVGSQLADRDSLTIPSGAQIRVVLPSGKTQTVKGPFNGTVAELAKGQPRNEGVLAWLSDILKTGGATEITPGATRSIGRVAPRPMGFSWSAVPVSMDSNVCLEKGAKVQLVRAPSSLAEHVTVIDTASSRRGEARWERAATPRPGPPIWRRVRWRLPRPRRRPAATADHLARAGQPAGRRRRPDHAARAGLQAAVLGLGARRRRDEALGDHGLLSFQLCLPSPACWLRVGRPR